MKKIILALVALFMATALNVVNAQTKEEMKASQERMEKLANLCQKEPKTTGVGEVDSYVKNVHGAAILSMATTEQLHDLYYRQIGETKDGVQDVTIKKPTIEELTALSVTIAAQAVTIKDAAASADKALTASKSQKNPLKVAKITTALAFTKNAYPVLLEESVAQTKAIAQMIETAKTAKNL
ncbi:hypothetical protein [Bacteroides congonensis]|uniref:hypothetical protein n=1 Tax=Bacteroides congonensis TaxID=1871006 RepID=UPI0026772CE7|nr:hypothetical protein [Bacteroides congonensis]